MEFNSFTFKLTDDCNYRCTYCQQKKAKNYLKDTHIESALNYFYPHFSGECYINFYGGEPLLAFPKIKNIVASLQEKNRAQDKKIHYTISTNGSLIDEYILEFFAEYNISPLISFDGLAQDITRKKGTFGPITGLIEKILAVDMEFLVNSVFTPETVSYLSESMQFLMQMGVKKIDLSLSTVTSWNDSAIERLQGELSRLRQLLLSFFNRTSAIPVTKFSAGPKKGVFICVAGRDRMTLAPDGKLWGCHVFPLYFRGKENSREYHKYCFGNLEFFMENQERVYPQILMNHNDLRMDCFCTQKRYCLFCDEMEECGICPIYAALSSGIIRMIPSWICEIKKIFRQEKLKFWKELDLVNEEGNPVPQ